MIRYRPLDCADAGILDERFVQNVGMAARTVERPATAFRVTVREVGPQRATVILSLTNTTGAALRMVFRTAQEYGAALYDSAGNELVVWSWGWAFAHAIHERLVGKCASRRSRLPAIGRQQVPERRAAA